MDTKKRKKNIMVTFAICILILNNTNYIRAYDGDGVTAQSATTTDSAGATAGNYDARINGTIDEFEFRVTLIDADGKKVDNTNIVEYGHNNDPKTYKIENFNSYPYDRIKYTFGYGTNTINYRYGTSENNYSFYNVKLTDSNFYSYRLGKIDFLDQYSVAADDFINNIKTRKKQYGIENNTTGNYDFLTMFLYHCGFLKSEDGNYYDIDDTTNNYIKGRKSDIAHNNYYLLIEPIFTTRGAINGTPANKRGTTMEIANFLIGTGSVPWGLMSAFTYTLGTGMFTPAGEYEFNAIEYGDNTFKTQNFFKGGATNPQVIKQWEITADPKSGAGVGIIRINAIITEPIDDEINISKNFCSETENGKNTGIIQFNIENNIDETTFVNTQNAGYKYKKYNSSNSDIYCYDNVTYNFSDMIETLNGITAKPTSNITIPTGKITVNRNCRVNSLITDYDIAKTTFMNNFDEYENQNIPLNLYNKIIELKKINKEDIIDNESNIKTLTGLINKKTGIYNVTATITFGYTENESKIYVEKNYGNDTASIDLSNVTFGYSNDLKNQIQDGQTYTYNNVTYNTHVTSNTENYVCSFKTPIEPPTPTTPSQKYETPDIQFRTIDLDNPFPARDGSSRLPGTNWLGKDNYVRTYITYNRGVRGNEVYEKEPLYKITLTPSDMVKIREYNKENDYSNINNELVCTDENNTACLSPFLVSNRYIEYDNKDGLCSRKKLETEGTGLKIDPNGIKDTNSNTLTNNITTIYDVISNNNDKGVNVFNYNYSNDQLKLDFNDDKILTLRDAYIYDFADKTTSFYTCADKTYENSGYIRKEQ